MSNYLSEIGTFLLGVAAILGVLVNWRATTHLRRQVQEVHEATNGMSHRLQVLAEQRGFAAGHQASEDEAERDH